LNLLEKVRDMASQQCNNPSGLFDCAANLMKGIRIDDIQNAQQQLCRIDAACPLQFVFLKHASFPYSHSDQHHRRATIKLSALKACKPCFVDVSRRASVQVFEDIII
jgi:hypothetical protein